MPPSNNGLREYTWRSSFKHVDGGAFWPGRPGQMKETISLIVDGPVHSKGKCLATTSANWSHESAGARIVDTLRGCKAPFILIVHAWGSKTSRGGACRQPGPMIFIYCGNIYISTMWPWKRRFPIQSKKTAISRTRVLSAWTISFEATEKVVGRQRSALHFLASLEVIQSMNETAMT